MSKNSVRKGPENAGIVSLPWEEVPRVSRQDQSLEEQKDRISRRLWCDRCVVGDRKKVRSFRVKLLSFLDKAKESLFAIGGAMLGK